MGISEQSQAVLLLTAWFSKPEKGEPKPLAPTEWGRFAQFLREKGLSPEALLRSNDLGKFLEGLSDRTIDVDRIEYLLGRSGALGFSLEKWQRAGLWVMTRSDADYPSSLKRHLKFDAPPVLFGCGNRQLLDKGGIAVIGSRDASPEDLSFATHLGSEIAHQGYSVVSGGARGVDEAAMLGALDREGTAIGVLSDSLLRASSSLRYRQSVMNRNLVLVSPFNPEAGFDVGNAMARNKYIYCLSSAAVVVSTNKDKGGTWSGATENLKRRWTPLWVKRNVDAASGNAALVKLGAQWLPDAPRELSSLYAKASLPVDESAEASLFEPQAATSAWRVEEVAPLTLEFSEAFAESQMETDLQGLPPDMSISEQPQVLAASVPDTAIPEMNDAPVEISFYEFFLRKLDKESALDALSLESLQERLGLAKAQLTEWLKRGVSEGHVEKHGKPTRYRTARVQRLF